MTDIAAIDRLVAWKGQHTHREFNIGMVKNGLWTCWIYDRTTRPAAIFPGKADDLAGKVESVLNQWGILEQRKADYAV